MKKIFGDYIHIWVLVAVGISGFLLYKYYQANKTETL